MPYFYIISGRKGRFFVENDPIFGDERFVSYKHK